MDILITQNPKEHGLTIEEMQKDSFPFVTWLYNYLKQNGVIIYEKANNEILKQFSRESQKYWKSLGSFSILIQNYLKQYDYKFKIKTSGELLFEVTLKYKDLYFDVVGEGVKIWMSKGKENKDAIDVKEVLNNIPPEKLTEKEEFIARFSKNMKKFIEDGEKLGISKSELINIFSKVK